MEALRLSVGVRTEEYRNNPAVVVEVELCDCDLHFEAKSHTELLSTWTWTQVEESSAVAEGTGESLAGNPDR